MSRKKTDIPNSMDIPSAIKLLRKKAGLSQSQLGLILDRSLATIQRYEYSQAMPDVGTLLILEGIASSLSASPEAADIFRGGVLKYVEQRLRWIEKLTFLYRRDK